MKVALVHDWLTGMRGGERVLEVLCELFPEASVFTLLYIPEKISKIINRMDIHISFIQHLPFAKTKYRQYLPLFPTAIEQFDLREYDLVISSSHCVAKGVISRPETCHVCYCHTPMRYAWEFYHDYFGPEKVGWFSSKIIPLFMNYLRVWDVTASKRVNYFIANSHNVAKRIYKYYGRKADVIHPPVNTAFFAPQDGGEDYFLIVSSLVPYKRIDIAIQAFNKLNLPLVIIGEGSERKRLERMAGDNIKFLGFQPDSVIKEYYAKCKAFIFPGEEDFGITPLEAQAAGRPVIAYGAGGVLESVVGMAPGVKFPTGILFYPQTSEALLKAIKNFNPTKFDSERIRKNALKFDVSIFKKKISQYIEEKYREHAHLYKKGQKIRY